MSRRIQGIPFTKMAGAGNDFLLVDAMHAMLGDVTKQWPAVARAMCDRRNGVGADGVLVLERSRTATVRMRIFNADGSEAEMCGNGARCVAAFISRWPGKSGNVTLETLGGRVGAMVRGPQVRLEMPEPRHLKLDVPLAVNDGIRSLASVDTGVPHVVALVDQVDRVDVQGTGRMLRHHDAFKPRGANVNFIETDAARPSRLRVRTYERGVEGETPACGTGVTASAVVHAAREDARRGPRTGTRRYQIEVQTKSGEMLTVSLSVRGEGRVRRVTDVTLEGPVRWVCQGQFYWPMEGRGR